MNSLQRLNYLIVCICFLIIYCRNRRKNSAQKRSPKASVWLPFLWPFLHVTQELELLWLSAKPIIYSPFWSYYRIYQYRNPRRMLMIIEHLEHGKIFDQEKLPSVFVYWDVFNVYWRVVNLPIHTHFKTVGMFITHDMWGFVKPLWDLHTLCWTPSQV